MMRDAAIAILRGRLARYTGTDLDTIIISEMQLKQEELEGGDFWPWFLLSSEQSFGTMADDPTVALPTNPRFIIEWEEGALWRYDASAEESYREIGKNDYDHLRALYPGTGEPKGYDIQGEFLWFAPTPDANYQYRWHYFARDAVLTTDIENQWLLHAPDWMIAATGRRIAAQVVKDQELAAEFAKDEAAAKIRVLKLDTARKEAQKRRIMGSIVGAS